MRALTRRVRHQAMLTALTILALLSLLVATDEDAAGAPAEPTANKPVRPAGKRNESEETPKPGRLAA